jgi:hypothetical protein
MRLLVLMALLIIANPAAQAPRVEKEWLGAAGQRTRAALFRSADAGHSPILVVVLQGDLGLANVLAINAASQIRNRSALVADFDCELVALGQLFQERQLRRHERHEFRTGGKSRACPRPRSHFRTRE